MANNKVTCSLITALNNKPSFVWHEKLGRFDSDWHQHPKGQLMYAENGCIHVNIEGKKLLLQAGMVLGSHLALTMLYGQIAPTCLFELFILSKRWKRTAALKKPAFSQFPICLKKCCAIQKSGIRQWQPMPRKQFSCSRWRLYFQVRWQNQPMYASHPLHTTNYQA